MTTPIGPSMKTDLDLYQMLPADVQKIIGGFLTPAELAKGAQISKLFHTIMNDNGTWIKVANHLNIPLKDNKLAKLEVFKHLEKQQLTNALNEIHVGLRDSSGCIFTRDIYSFIKSILEFFPTEIQKQYDEDTLRVSSFDTSLRDLITYIRANIQKFQPVRDLILQKFLQASSSVTAIDLFSAKIFIDSGLLDGNRDVQFWRNLLTQFLDLSSIEFKDPNSRSALKLLFQSIFKNFEKSNLTVSQKAECEPLITLIRAKF